MPQDFEDRAVLEKALTDATRPPRKDTRPKTRQKRHLVTLVETNAKIAFEQRFRVLKPDSQKVLEELQELLELSYFPERIESFDISNISGSENVAGIVVFENGKPARYAYRRFIIKSVEGRTILPRCTRPFSPLQADLEEKPLPRTDLYRRRQGPAFGRRGGDAGSRSRTDNARRPRQTAKTAITRYRILLIHGREDRPIPFDRNSLAFRLILQIREETHKTAIEFHRKRREKRDFSSELSEIPGIGEKRKMKLLREFGSIERIAKATADELSPFVGPKAAAEIASHFENQRN